MQFEGILFDETMHDEFLQWVNSGSFDVVKRMMLGVRLRMLRNLEDETSTMDAVRIAQGGLVALKDLEAMIDGFRAIDVEEWKRLEDEKEIEDDREIDVSL